MPPYHCKDIHLPPCPLTRHGKRIPASYTHHEAARSTLRMQAATCRGPASLAASICSHLRNHKPLAITLATRAVSGQAHQACGTMPETALVSARVSGRYMSSAYHCHTSACDRTPSLRAPVAQRRACEMSVSNHDETSTSTRGSHVSSTRPT